MVSSDQVVSVYAFYPYLGELKINLVKVIVVLCSIKP